MQNNVVYFSLLLQSPVLKVPWVLLCRTLTQVDVSERNWGKNSIETLLKSLKINHLNEKNKNSIPPKGSSPSVTLWGKWWMNTKTHIRALMLLKLEASM